MGPTAWVELERDSQGRREKMPRGKMVEGGEKNLPPNEVRRFPSTELCKAAPVPVSAGSQLTLRMLKGKRAFPSQLPSPNSWGNCC